MRWFKMCSGAMQEKNLYLKLRCLHSLAQIKPHIIELFQNLLSSILQNEISREVVMMTVESHDLFTGMCEIIALVSDDHQHLGRQEKYDNCIYSNHSESRNRIVVIESVKEHPGYLSLDGRVKSEIFVEYSFSDSINLILNAEFSTTNISNEMKKWFNQMCRIFFEEKNKTNNLF
ncbi:hypothetical protein ACFLT2_02375 [Acidobacteriota bacterium]